MKTQEKIPASSMVRAPSRSLAVRAGAIVTRGLVELSRDSNWLTKKVFAGRASRLAVSPAGRVCAALSSGTPQLNRLVVYDIEHHRPDLVLTTRGGEQQTESREVSAALAWSPTGHQLIAAQGGWLPQLHVFDLKGGALLAAFGSFSQVPIGLAWSENGSYVAAAFTGGEDARLRLWQAKLSSEGQVRFTNGSVGEAGISDWRKWTAEMASSGESADGGPEISASLPGPTGEGEDGRFLGFGRMAFSADGMRLASVVESDGEWTDDSLVVLDTPDLRKRNLFHAQAHITDVTWTHDGRGLIFCSGGQAFRLAPESSEAETLPFGAELCACHPHLPFCVCFSSWLRNSAKGRLFLVDLRQLKVFDEHAAESIAELRWSLDGSKAYAVSRDGVAHIYDPPQL